MSLGDNCRSGCLTRDHESFGQCARAASIQIDRYALSPVGGVELDKKKDSTLERFRQCVSSGVTPEAPTLTQVRRAEKVLENA